MTKPCDRGRAAFKPFLGFLLGNRPLRSQLGAAAIQCIDSCNTHTAACRSDLFPMTVDRFYCCCDSSLSTSTLLRRIRTETASKL